MSGHSKWSKVKNQKAVTDAKRGKIFSKLAKLITVASREGSDPNSNPKLRTALEKAHDFSMPNDNIERAIKRGSGLADEVQLEELIIEAYGPAGSALIIKAITDNKNRTLSEIRKILDQHQGKPAESGSVRWMFKEIGKIIIDKNNWSDNLAMLAIENGAEDIKEEDDKVQIIADISNLHKLKEALAPKTIIEETLIDYQGQQEVEIKDEAQKQATERLFEALDDHQDVDEIYSNTKL